jgi:hypothetical protein
MICTTDNPAKRRYSARFRIVMTVYVVFLLLTVWVFKHYHPTGVAAYLLAVLPALPIVAMIVFGGLYLAEEKDEFVRNVTIQSLLWGIGGTLAITTVWGFLEDFANVPRLDLYLVFPLFWFLVGASTPFVKRRYR